MKKVWIALIFVTVLSVTLFEAAQYQDFDMYEGNWYNFYWHNSSGSNNVYGKNTNRDYVYGDNYSGKATVTAYESNVGIYMNICRRSAYLDPYESIKCTNNFNNIDEDFRTGGRYDNISSNGRSIWARLE